MTSTDDLKAFPPAVLHAVSLGYTLAIAATAFAAIKDSALPGMPELTPKQLLEKTLGELMFRGAVFA